MTPSREPMQGRLSRLETLDATRHARALHEAYAADPEGRNWTYLPYEPFASAEIYEAAVASMQNLDHTIFYAIIEEPSGAPVGVTSYLRIDPPMGSIEVGHLSYSPALKAALQGWLNPANFDERGLQRRALSTLIADARNAAETRG